MYLLFLPTKRTKLTLNASHVASAREREEAESRRVRNAESHISQRRFAHTVGSLPEVVSMHVEISAWVGRRLEKTGGINPLYVAEGPVNF